MPVFVFILEIGKCQLLQCSKSLQTGRAVAQKRVELLQSTEPFDGSAPSLIVSPQPDSVEVWEGVLSCVVILSVITAGAV